MNKLHAERWFGVPLALWLLQAQLAAAGSIDVRVLDPYGQPVPGVAVFIEQHDDVSQPPALPRTAVMDQLDKEFVPHLLIVQKGTAVDFPNSDVIAHHVYSFSKPNDFVLPLYKGKAHDPIRFDHDGVVTIGCNIHDNMLGYIVVVDTDVFGVTDESGRVTLPSSDAAQSYQVRIWSPRIRDRVNTLLRRVDAPVAQNAELIFSMQEKLWPPHDQQPNSVQWSDY